MNEQSRPREDPETALVCLDSDDRTGKKPERSELWHQLQRRRESARRLPPLADGRRDPWSCTR